MGWLDKLRATPAVLPKLACAPDPKAAPGQRVYHEYFVADAPVNGRYNWHCRVYAAGQVHEMTGSDESDRAAREAAIKWATETKAKLRGGV